MTLKHPIKPSVIFFGTAAFAVSALDMLVANGVNVKAVVTAPDKPAGRGNKLHQSDVKTYCIASGLRVIQPEKLKSEDFLQQLQELNADLFIIIAFRMLPKEVWQMPKLGTFNIHASLLPNYRGAAPIHWAVINGEKETGVTSFFLQHEIDTGPVIFQERTAINPEETTGALYNRLAEMSAMLCLKTYNAIAIGEVPSLPQQYNESLRHAPKILSTTGIIDPCKLTAHAIVDLVRGLQPAPAARISLASKNFKVHKAVVYNVISASAVELPDTFVNGDCGQYIATGGRLLMQCANRSVLEVLQLQEEGKKSMPTKDYLLGNKL